MRRPPRILVAVAALSLCALPSAAVARVIQAYLLFEADPSKTDAVREKLRGTSLGNCLQVLVGHPAPNEIIVHLACDEQDDRNPTGNLNRAVLELSAIDGVKRASIMVVRRD
jgi:hypothetical protein